MMKLSAMVSLSPNSSSLSSTFIFPRPPFCRPINPLMEGSIIASIRGWRPWQEESLHVFPLRIPEITSRGLVGNKALGRWESFFRIVPEKMESVYLSRNPTAKAILDLVHFTDDNPTHGPLPRIFISELVVYQMTILTQISHVGGLNLITWFCIESEYAGWTLESMGTRRTTMSRFPHHHLKSLPISEATRTYTNSSNKVKLRREGF